MTVTRPAKLCALSNASGISVSESIARIAPAATAVVAATGEGRREGFQTEPYDWFRCCNPQNVRQTESFRDDSRLRCCIVARISVVTGATRPMEIAAEARQSVHQACKNAD